MLCGMCVCNIHCMLLGGVSAVWIADESKTLATVYLVTMASKESCK